jgi:hypothetical protein
VSFWKQQNKGQNLARKKKVFFFKKKSNLQNHNKKKKKWTGGEKEGKNKKKRANEQKKQPINKNFCVYYVLKRTHTKIFNRVVFCNFHFFFFFAVWKRKMKTFFESARVAKKRKKNSECEKKINFKHHIFWFENGVPLSLRTD